MNVDNVDRLAQRQHGVVTLVQLVGLGYAERTVHHWVEAARLARMHPGVYRLAGVTPMLQTRVMAAVLAAGVGSAASHRTAAYLWGLIEEEPEVVEIAVPRRLHPRLHGLVVHRSRDLAPRWISARHRIPTVNPLLTMVDLGAVMRHRAVEDCLDRGLIAGRFSVAAVEWAYTEVARPGRRGCGVLRRILDQRALGAARADGLLEPRMARLLKGTSLAMPVFQFDVYSADGVWLARVDFAYPHLKLAIEVDGWSAHGTPGALQRDLTRQNRLILEGWTVLRFTWEDVVTRPKEVATAIAAALEALAA